MTGNHFSVRWVSEEEDGERVSGGGGRRGRGRKVVVEVMVGWSAEVETVGGTVEVVDVMEVWR